MKKVINAIVLATVELFKSPEKKMIQDAEFDFVIPGRKRLDLIHNPKVKSHTVSCNGCGCVIRVCRDNVIHGNRQHTSGMLFCSSICRDSIDNGLHS